MTERQTEKKTDGQTDRQTNMILKASRSLSGRATLVCTTQINVFKVSVTENVLFCHLTMESSLRYYSDNCEVSLFSLVVLFFFSNMGVTLMSHGYHYSVTENIVVQHKW